MVTSRGLHGTINGTSRQGTPASVSVSSEKGATYLGYNNVRHRIAASALSMRNGIEIEALVVFGVSDGVFTPR